MACNTLACVALMVGLVYGILVDSSMAADGKITDENVARAWLNDFNERAMRVYYTYQLASWNYYTNLTDHNRRLSVSSV